MNYQKIYDDLVYKAKSENRKKGLIYYEKHHIIPRCFNGDNSKENTVLLTAKEHFIAHLLLIELHEGRNKAKMSFALFQMCRKNNQHKRVISSKQFEKARLLMKDNCSGVNSNFYGKTHTPEVKEVLRKRMLSNDNPSRKFDVWNKGKKLKPLSTEQKNKISVANKGQVRSDETKNKISLSKLGKPKSDKHKKKLSQALKGNVRTPESIKATGDKLRGKKQSILICPYCNKSGGTTMHRWHFENCKLK